MRATLYLFVFLIFGNLGFAQKTLQILKVKPGSFKKYEIFVGDVLEYKLKGQHFYKLNKIANMNDSLIMFENDTIIKLSQIKVIKLHNGNHLMQTFSGAFMIGGVALIALNFVNNLLFFNTFGVDTKIWYISGGLLAAAIILKQLSIKRLHIKGNVSLKVLDLNFQKLN